MHNPYNYHVAVRDDTMFFGREEILARLVRGLDAPIPAATGRVNVSRGFLVIGRWIFFVDTLACVINCFLIFMLVPTKPTGRECLC